MTGQGIFNTGSPFTGPVTVEQIRQSVEQIRQSVELLPQPTVILTPSIEALEAVFGAVPVRSPATPTDRLTGIPVHVTELVDRPRIVPVAEWQRMRGVGTGLRG